MGERWQIGDAVREAFGWFKYVRHDDVPHYETRGWRLIGPAPGHHGYYSCIMEWKGEGEPPNEKE